MRIIQFRGDIQVESDTPSSENDDSESDSEDSAEDSASSAPYEFDDGEEEDFNQEGVTFVFKRQVRCVAHRLQLALHSAFKSIEEMGELQKVIKS